MGIRKPKPEKFYLPGENLTIDEQLVPFRGRVSFKQYLPSKPDKYGMKIWWICDSKTSYPYLVYHISEKKDKRAENLAYNVVNQLCEPYFEGTEMLLLIIISRVLMSQNLWHKMVLQ
ncbi:PiggyBac transposable element-derived protein 4 [Eumeta japonica]|uniref:PiggyBac transposable element-derived protein 4 n=1 Tax=Eumeta variegata TaxID=151549 RepID=A0A4C1WC36_EUMVA|nr:PiggyBac transposable element-derived protein 4 [Eumeta japonica]